MSVPLREYTRHAKLDLGHVSPSILEFMPTNSAMMRSVDEIRRRPESEASERHKQVRSALTERLKNFVYKESAAWKEITRRYGEELTQNELLCIAEVIASNLGIVIDREAKRRKNVLIKWFDENLEVITPFFERLRLIGSDGCPISQRADN